MTQNDRQLLLKDLCARLPYGIMCHANEINLDGELLFINKVYNIVAIYNDKATGKFDTCPIADIKPYLRPLSSMTDEENDEFQQLDTECDKMPTFDYVSIEHYRIFDWLNSHHFDYRGLIGKGLAIEVTEENNPYKLEE